MDHQKDEFQETAELAEACGQQVLNKMVAAGLFVLADLNAAQWTWFCQTTIMFLQKAAFPDIEESKLDGLWPHEIQAASLGSDAAWLVVGSLATTDIRQMTQQDHSDVFESLIEGFYGHLNSLTWNPPF